MVDGGKPEVGSRDEGKHTGRKAYRQLFIGSSRLRTEYDTQILERTICYSYRR